MLRARTHRPSTSAEPLDELDAMLRASGFTKHAAMRELDAIYAGPKAELRPIHDAFMTGIAAFGPFEFAPKKAYLSLRRRKPYVWSSAG